MRINFNYRTGFGLAHVRHGNSSVIDTERKLVWRHPLLPRLRICLRHSASPSLPPSLLTSNPSLGISNRRHRAPNVGKLINQPATDAGEGRDCASFWINRPDNCPRRRRRRPKNNSINFVPGAGRAGQLQESVGAMRSRRIETRRSIHQSSAPTMTAGYSVEPPWSAAAVVVLRRAQRQRPDVAGGHTTQRSDYYHST